MKSKSSNAIVSVIFVLAVITTLSGCDIPEGSEFGPCGSNADCTAGFFCAKDPTRVSGDVRPELESIQGEDPKRGLCITPAQTVEPPADDAGMGGDALPDAGTTPDAEPIDAELSPPDASHDAGPPDEGPGPDTNFDASPADAARDSALPDATPDALPDAAPKADGLPPDAAPADAGPDVLPPDAAPPPECEPGFLVGDPQACEGVNTGQCRTGERVCRLSDGEAHWTACFGRIGPTNEICDGLDNDCDEVIDEDFVGLTQPCGQGACARELPVCQNGAPVACNPFEGARVEACDGIADEDCDGSVDEDCLCANGVEEPCGPPEPATEPCARGMRRCDNGRWGACEGARFPQPEVCNALDDDCDGTADEGVKNACNRCGDVPVEVCNDRDDDCDGETDEDVLNACGACGRLPAETCNLTDDDCDGVVDNNFLWLDPESEEVVTTGEECSVGVGACERFGRVYCAARDRAECDTHPGDPSPELCNLTDDDCDGLIDNSPTDIGRDCTVGRGFCQRNGAEVCRDGELVCGVEPGRPRAEACNAIDDDCDGIADNNFAGNVIPCGIGVCYREAVEQCVNGRIQVECVPGQPTGDDSICDGRDEDCDGDTDEDYVVTPTECGFGECVSQGERICADGREVNTCIPGPLAGLDNDCDNVDEDCDGTADEHYVDVPIQCGIGVCLRNGFRVCRDHAPVDDCTPGRSNGEDAECNGEDNDCDGLVDESSRIGEACVSGLGVCERAGLIICDAGASVCDAVAGDPSPEACNSLDDDCDGEVDEQCGTCPAGLDVPGFSCISAAQFTMGSPLVERDRNADEVPHQVFVTRPFLTQVAEVTQSQWFDVTGQRPSLRVCDNCPVDRVTWYQAIAFTNALSALEGLPRCYADRDDGSDYDFVDAGIRKTPVWRNGPACLGYRLPTEAEWELLARCGENRAVVGMFDGESYVLALGRVGWFLDNSGMVTHEVGGLAANNCGLRDVHGNVFEWTWDWYGAYPPGQLLSDPLGSDQGAERIVRGGSYNRDAAAQRLARRSTALPNGTFSHVGLRLVRTVEP